ncbi:hypothetical protein AcW1_001639 [Taiwanofungus camphoratus]|nr:hypothetical protein AcV7_001496 [Antrodia cinnamomea]KAI0945406.1 hypothetical protein AcW1_001639 [Antrodia cinnamomea]
MEEARERGASSVMYAYKDLLELAGLTTRLYTLLSTLHNVPPLPSTADDDHRDWIELKNVDVGISLSSASTNAGSQLGASTSSNGFGKTAVARVLASLWAAQGQGEVRMPAGRQGVFVVPQRSYMVTGSLLDQVIYPYSYPEFVESGKTEEDLMEILVAANLAYLPVREGGWNTRKECRDVLSGGEKQRMGLARVFYHRPKFAVLDECTSAVSSDVEGRMYEHAKSLGITLITISLRSDIFFHHRCEPVADTVRNCETVDSSSLARYHTQLLTLTGDGTSQWTFSRIGIDREIIALENKLADVKR